MLRQRGVLHDRLVQSVGALFDGCLQKLGVFFIRLERTLGEPLLESVDLPLGGLRKRNNAPHVFQRVLHLEVLQIIVLLFLHIHKVVGPALDFVPIIFGAGHELLGDLLSLDEVIGGALDHALEFRNTVGHGEQGSRLIALQEVGSGRRKLVHVRVVVRRVQIGLRLDDAQVLSDVGRRVRRSGHDGLGDWNGELDFSIPVGSTGNGGAVEWGVRGSRKDRELLEDVLAVDRVGDVRSEKVKSSLDLVAEEPNVVVVGIQRTFCQPLFERRVQPLVGLGQNNAAALSLEGMWAFQLVGVVAGFRAVVHKVVGSSLDFVLVVFGLGDVLIVQFLPLDGRDGGLIENPIEFGESEGHGEENLGLLFHVVVEGE